MGLFDDVFFASLESFRNKSGKSLIKEAEGIVNEKSEEYEQEIIIDTRTSIPDSDDIPIRNDNKERLPKWIKVPDVISVYVDMVDSTKLSATKHDKSTAKVYEYFTDSAIRIFHAFGASYIDIKGDGVFALFNSNQVHRALCAAVTFKTQARDKIIPEIRKKTGIDSIGTHMGIDQKTVLVKKIGLQHHESHENKRHNEVWAGAPINMSAKLASKSSDGQLIISDRFFSKITSPKAKKTCGCRGEKYTGEFCDVWQEEYISDPKFNFDKIYIGTSCWCKIHGEEYCTEIMNADDES